MSTSRMLFTSLIRTLGAMIAMFAVLAAIAAIPLVVAHVLDIDTRAETTQGEIMRFIFCGFILVGMSLGLWVADRIALGPYDRR